jgi:urate oxidase
MLARYQSIYERVVAMFNVAMLNTNAELILRVVYLCQNVVLFAR